MRPPFSCAKIAPAYLPLYRLGFATPAASSSRMPPSRPRASARSRGLACDPRDARRLASTSMALLSARPTTTPPQSTS
jgi:hypothetical protein